MNLMQLIENMVKDEGYDGLFDAGVCACKLGDIAPCGDVGGSCELGMFVDGDDCDNCAGAAVPAGCDFHIGNGTPRVSASKLLVKACKAGLPWVAKMINSGAHEDCVGPRRCESAMNIMIAALDEAKESISGTR